MATETQTQTPVELTHDAPPVVRDALYIGGEWVAPAGAETIDVIDSTTEQVMGTVPMGTAADVDRAVAAARAAFDGWASTPVADRVALCQRAGEMLAMRGEEIAALESREVGMPIALSRFIQAGLPTMDFASIPQAAQETAWEEEVGNSLVVREPVGVVAAITPWNYPLHQLSAKVAPALAAGCTVVAKPSEVTPLSAFVLAEILEAVGLPPGVFNLVTGDAANVGEPLVAHPGVDMISFTGSTAAGRRISAVAARTIKRVHLELGGKSPNVILGDAPFQEAVVDGIGKCFLNSGQTCSALTRMLVPRERLAEAEAIAAAAVAQTPV
ncbi:MAG TPA: aldehyde dehydrogenase family protein, partial [Solirubrobacteraceae bacterium]